MAGFEEKWNRALSKSSMSDKREGASSNGASASRVSDIMDRLKTQYDAQRELSRVGMDTLANDYTDTLSKVGGAMTSWQSPSEMRGIKEDVRSLSSRMNSYQNYNKLTDTDEGRQARKERILGSPLGRSDNLLTAGLDADISNRNSVRSAANTLKNLGENVDNLSDHYSQWNDRDSFGTFQKYNGKTLTYDQIQRELGKKNITDSDRDYLSNYGLNNGYNSLQDFDRDIADREARKSPIVKGISEGDTPYTFAENMRAPEQDDIDKLKSMRNQYALDHKFDYYKGYMDAPDYDSKAQYDPSIQDLGYQYLNGGKAAAQRYIDSLNLDNTNAVTENARLQSFENFEYLTENEKGVYNYLMSTNPQKAAEYLKAMKITVDKRVTEADALKAQERAKNNSAWGNVGDSLLSVVPNMVGGIVAGISNIGDRLLGNEVNPYQPANRLANAVSAYREAVSNEINENAGGVWSFLYNTGMSMLDSAAGMAIGNLSAGTSFAKLGKNLYGISMGLGAGSQRIKELVEQGATEEQALVGGALSGIAEGFFEEYSLEKLISIKDVDTKRKILTNFLKQSFTEGSEEVFTEIANILIDGMNRGNLSDYARKIDEYMKAGMSEEEARSQALKDKAMDVVLAGLGGAISGGVMGGLHSVGQYAYNTYKGKKAEGLVSDSKLVDKARNLEGESEFKENALRYDENDLKPAQRGSLLNNAVHASEVRLNNAEAVAAKGSRGIKTGEQNFAGKVLNTFTRDDEQYIKTTEGEIKFDDAVMPQNLKDVVGFANEISNKTERAQFLANYDGESNIAEYATAFSYVYQSGIYGLNKSNIKTTTFTAEQIDSIYEAGRALNEQARQSFEEERTKVALESQKAIDKAVSKYFKKNGQYKAGKYDTSALKGANLTEEQWGAIYIGQKLFETMSLPVNVEYFLSDVDEKGNFTAEQGRFDAATNTIRIDARAGFKNLSEGSVQILQVMSHELTHWAETKSPVLYKQLSDVVLDAMAAERGVTRDNVIVTEMRSLEAIYKANNIDVKVTDTLAISELVARACEGMLTDDKAFDSYTGKLDQKQRSVFVQRVQKLFGKIADFFRELAGKFETKSKEWKELNRQADLMDKAKEKWGEMLASAMKAGQADTESRDNNNGVLYELRNPVNTDYTLKQRLDMILNEEFPKRIKHVYLGVTPDLSFAGIDTKGLPMVMRVTKAEAVMENISAHGNTHAHNLGSAGLIKIIKGIAKPNKVILQRNGNIGIEVITIQDKRTYYSVVQLDGSALFDDSYDTVNVLVSAFDCAADYAERQGRVIYDAKKITPDMQVKDISDGDKFVNISGVGNRISLSESVVNIKNVSDNEYLELAQNPEQNEAKLREMVEEAAKAAGYSINVWHGTKSKFNVFAMPREELGIHFGTKEQARQIAGRGKNAVMQNDIIKVNNPIRIDTDLGSWYPDYVAKKLFEIGVLSKNEAEDILFTKDRRFKRDDSSAIKDLRALLTNKGYDAIVYPNQFEGKKVKDSYLIWNKANVKSAELVTYDNAGNVIPLSERFKSDNNDMRYSLRDSEGNTLSEQQAEYFADSKVRDEDGNLLVMYHGTPNEFTVFDPVKFGGKNGVQEGFGIYMSSDASVAKTYGDKTIKGYVNITNPARSDKKTLTTAKVAKLIERTVKKQAEKLMVDGGYKSINDAMKDTWVSNVVDTYSSPLSTAIREAAAQFVKYDENDMDIIRSIMATYPIRDYESAYEFYDILKDTLGFDGFITEWENRENGEKTTIALPLNSNQIKNVDNENPTSNADIRYSMRDSEGRELSIPQQEFFAESQARDENGSLFTLYHGSKSKAFTVFDSHRGGEFGGIWLSTDKKYSKEYAKEYHNWRDDEGTQFPREDLNGLESEVYGDKDFRIYEVYANIKNPLDLGEISRTYYDGFLPSLIKKMNLTKEDYKELKAIKKEFDKYHIIYEVWELTKTDEFQKFVKAHGFDGMVATELGTQTFCAFDSEQVKLTTNVNPTSNADIRYSMRDSKGKELTPAQQEFFANSKVRDEEGNLLVMYHGSVSTEKFSVFDLDAKGLVNGRVFGDGFYFTPDKKAARRWSKGIGKIYKTYLNITNPYYASADDSIPTNVLEYLKNKNGEIYDKLKAEMGEKWWGSKMSRAEYVEEESTRLFKNAEDALAWMGDNKTDILRSFGYDGIIYKDSKNNYPLNGGEQYVVFDSNQIKNVTNKKPTESEDIRYSLRGDTATLEADTIEKMLQNYAASNPNYAQAYITYMSPSDFLKLTAPNMERIANESRELNIKDLSEVQKSQAIHLTVDETDEGWEVYGHEGRHRMYALMQQGIERVPVLIFNSSNKYSKVAHDSATLIEQDFGRDDYEGKTVDIGETIPFSRGNEAEIRQKFGGDSSVKFSLRDTTPLELANEYVDIAMTFDTYNAMDDAEGYNNLADTVDGLANDISNGNVSDIISSLEDIIGDEDYDIDDVQERAQALLETLKSIPNVKFSLRDSDNAYNLTGELEKAQRKNKALQDDVDRLKERLALEKKLTGGKLAKRDAVSKLAKKFISESGIEYDSEELTDSLMDLFSKRLNEKSLDDGSFQNDINALARELAQNIKAEDYRKDAYNSLLKQIRSTKFKVTDVMMGDAVHYAGGKKELNRMLFGKIRISQTEGRSLDSFFEEMKGEYPELFTDTVEGDMIPTLIGIYNDIREAQDVVDTYYDAEAEKYFQSELVNIVWQLPEVKTTADKWKAKVDAMRLEHSKTMQEMRDDFKTQLKSQKVADDIYYNKTISNLRAQRDAREAAAREYGRRKLDAYRDRKARQAEIAKITDKAKTLMKWYDTNNKDKHIAKVMQQPVLEFLSALDFSSEQLLGRRGGEKVGTPTKKDVSLAKAFRHLATFMREANGQSEETTDIKSQLSTYLDIPMGYAESLDKLSTKLEDIASRRGDNVLVLNDLSLEELKEVRADLTTLKAIVTNVNKLIGNMAFAHCSDCAQNTMQYVGSIKTNGKLKGAVSDFFNWTETLPFYAFQRFGEGGRSIFNELMSGYSDYAFKLREVFNFEDKVLGSKGEFEKKAKEWSEKIHKIEIAEGKTIQMTTAQIMSLYCINKRELRLQELEGEYAPNHLRGGGIRIADIKVGRNSISQAEDTKGLSSKTINKITALLTDEQVRVADEMQKFMSTTCSEWGNATSMKRFGIESFTEDMYFPIESDQNNIQSDATDNENSLFRLLNMSFTKSLTRGANNAVTISNIFDVFANHTVDMAKYGTLAIPVLDTFKWLSYVERTDKDEEGAFKTASLKASLEAAFGKGAERYVKEFLKDLNGSQTGGRDDKLTSKLISNAKVVAVAFNLRVAALQPTAYFRAAAVLSAGDMAAGFTKPSSYRRAQEHSGLAYWKSLGFYDINVQKSVQAMLKGEKTLRDKIVDVGLKAAEKGDELTWGFIWNACEHNIKRNNPNLDVNSEEFYKTVAKKLDEVVVSTQVIDTPLTRSQKMRDKGGLSKLSTAFMAEPTVSLNIVTNAVNQFKDDVRRMGKGQAFAKNRTLILKSSAAYVITATVNAIAEAFMDAIRGMADDDDDDFIEAFAMKYGDNFWANFVEDMSLLAKIPVVKEAYAQLRVGDLAEYIHAEMRDGTLETKDVIDKWKKLIKSNYTSSRMDTALFDTMRKAYVNLDKAIDKKEIGYKDVYSWLQFMSQASGIPLSTLFRDFRAVWNDVCQMMGYNSLELFVSK